MTQLTNMIILMKLRNQLFSKSSNRFNKKSNKNDNTHNSQTTKDNIYGNSVLSSAWAWERRPSRDFDSSSQKIEKVDFIKTQFIMFS